MRGVTRTTIVLFTDLVGSTEAMTRAGAAADGLRNRHFAALRGALAVHRGTEVKTTGDGLMVTFESVYDAVACAGTMQRGQELDLRIGISAGEVTHIGGDCFGPPVVEASRLCAVAEGGQILLADVVRALGGTHQPHGMTLVGDLDLKGLPAPVKTWEAAWQTVTAGALRVALADDAVLLRQAVARVLEGEGFEVVLQVGDAQALLEQLPAARPHVVVLDVRMPPTNTTEGLDAAERIRSEHPDVGVLVLSGMVHLGAAERLFADSARGVGYMLKERVTEVDELVAAIRAVAGGGRAFDSEVVRAIPAGG